MTAISNEYLYFYVDSLTMFDINKIKKNQISCFHEPSFVIK